MSLLTLTTLWWRAWLYAWNPPQKLQSIAKTDRTD
jgi:hypothetical protein